MRPVFFRTPEAEKQLIYSLITSISGAYSLDTIWPARPILWLQHQHIQPTTSPPTNIAIDCEGIPVSLVVMDHCRGVFRTLSLGDVLPKTDRNMISNSISSR